MTITQIRARIHDVRLRLVTLMEQGGKEAAFEGVRLLNPDSYTILGALIRATYILYRTAEGEEKARLKAALKRFFDWTKDDPCKTWGKLSLLSVLTEMKERDELSLLSEELLRALREKTDFRDFYDEREKKLLGPTAANYVHVAASCAKGRSRLGWESEATVSAITEHLLRTVAANGAGGFLDDEPGEGRYDSYTFMVARHLPDQCEEAGIPIPKDALENLATAARAMLKMANRRGDGFVYGRSLSVYGDLSPAGVLAAALKHKLLTKAEADLAYAYILASFEKICRFWYDEARGIFNIWLDGRSTDGYREIHRLLETNLDVCSSLEAVLDTLTDMGMVPAMPMAEIPVPEVWQASRICFLDAPDRHAEMIILRRKDTLVMLPLIGGGSISAFSAYCPFPAVAGVLEAAPQSEEPFLIPEYEMAGRPHRPIRFYSDIEMKEENDKVTVRAQGHMALIGRYPICPKRTEYTFTTEYVFDGEKISARFETDMPYDRARMRIAETAKATHIKTHGFDSLCELPLGTKDTLAPHGAYTYVHEHSTKARNALGWTATLPE